MGAAFAGLQFADLGLANRFGQLTVHVNAVILWMDFTKAVGFGITLTCK
jgi:hypothetical protein